VTDITKRTRVGIITWIRHWQRDLSDRLHAAGDEQARQYSWEVIKSTGRFGFGACTYRDPRFDDRRRQLSDDVAQLTERAHPEAGRHNEVEQ
jgi:hypothetical protein